MRSRASLVDILGEDKRLLVESQGVDLFVSICSFPCPAAGGRMGATHIRLAKANRDILTGALQAAWKLRADMNAATRSGRRTRRPRR